MSRISFCVSSKEQIKKMFYERLTYNWSINEIFLDLMGVINQYNYCINEHNRWIKAPKDVVLNNKTMQKLFNVVSTSAKETGKTIYSEQAENAKMQIDGITEAIIEYANTLNEKSKNSLIKKLNTRLNKMQNF